MKNDEVHMVRELRAGRESAFSWLFKEYYRPLTVYAFKYISDMESAREIVQDLFVYLYENRKTILITGSLKSYLYHSVRNRSLNLVRKEQTRRKHMAQLQGERHSSDDPESMIRETEMEHQVFLIISALPPQCRRVFLLSREKGLSNGEIAGQLEISKRTVEKQISNALKAIRSGISDLAKP